MVLVCFIGFPLSAFMSLLRYGLPADANASAPTQWWAHIKSTCITTQTDIVLTLARGQALRNVSMHKWVWMDLHMLDCARPCTHEVTFRINSMRLSYLFLWFIYVFNSCLTKRSTWDCESLCEGAWLRQQQTMSRSRTTIEERAHGYTSDTLTQSGSFTKMPLIDYIYI